jgi:tRNA(Ile)-lysidine synthase
LNNTVISFQYILELINSIPGNGCCWIAYSGGIDSTVLLHLLNTKKDKIDRYIKTVHVNHKISNYADNWADHCRKVCSEYQIPFELITLDASNNMGYGPEAHARKLRYEAISRLLSENDILLTAHHKDDLAETLILQLLRGAGPEGLAAMPQIRKFDQGWIVRPLIEYTRGQLNAYATENKLNWIDDESNSDINFDRNYVRNEVIPVLEFRWPAVSRLIARSARHQADILDILRDIAENDLKKNMAGSTDVLNIAEFNKLSRARKRNLLRFWLKMNNKPATSSIITDQIITNLVEARSDSQPLISWCDTEIRRYRDKIYLLKKLPQLDSDISYIWKLPKALDLSFGRLEAEKTTGKGIKIASLVNNILDVRFRHGGEKIQPSGRKETHKLKKMYQQAGIPPWKRDRIPLLYINDHLVSVTGYWIDQNFNAQGNEPGWDISLVEY